jgi:pSer/pThr/pTyr-binding forkhead associated (FHA) protein
MAENTQPPKKSFSPDWLVQGVLTKVGDTFDRLTGRGWKPSSSLATSELVERLKTLLDSEIKENGDGRKFVPHNIKLKMQWDKFSTDGDDNLRKLEAELLTAAVDHINDKRYYTYAPLSLEVKPDYFTSGVKLFVGFEKFDKEDREAEMNVSIPGAKLADILPEEAPEPLKEIVIVQFLLNGNVAQKIVTFEEGKQLTVGRTKENDVAINDPSVSKFHASLLLNADGQLMVADTGSTNGTFINGERIAYGKAIAVGRGDKLKFGTVETVLQIQPKPPEIKAPPADLPKTESYSVGEFEFTKRIDTAPAIEQDEPAKTEASVPVTESEPAKDETFAPQPGLTEQGFKLESEDEEKEPEPQTE